MVERRRSSRGRRKRKAVHGCSCPGDAILCPDRYSDRLLRGTAARINRVAREARSRHFQEIRFLLDLWRAMHGMSLEDVLHGRPPEGPRRA